MRNEKKIALAIGEAMIAVAIMPHRGKPGGVGIDKFEVEYRAVPSLSRGAVKIRPGGLAEK